MKRPAEVNMSLMEVIKASKSNTEQEWSNLPKHDGMYLLASYLSAEMEDAFVAALVIYVVSSVFTPVAGRRSNDIDIKVIMSVLHPHNVGKFNWAKYTLDALMSAAQSIQLQLKDKSIYPRYEIGGCQWLLM